ncbi:hypothetical protein [Estrella lausannensis]|uniref:Uncharacterized protein n=1 Tax=Estrella lausannensis TaxID=483423 RepID=A0A0H5DP76_9BACT|nr:hypothetical protein [Estrella lausannensis]CRX37728.1 hypothetical protein ELAC_0367 [Estrella lausannensis]
MNRSVRKRLIFSLVLLALIAGSIKTFLRVTDDFRLSSITHEMPHKKEWEISLNDSQKKELETIFNQRFTYLGKGAQAYAFVSQDGKYVLKFFKFKHLRPNFLLLSVPAIGPLAEWKRERILRKEEKLNSVFGAYRLAWRVHRQEAGLLFIHLNRTDDLKKAVEIEDKIGLKWTVNLDDVTFVVQRRVETSRKIIYGLLKEGRVAEAKDKIHKIFDLYVAEYQKGLFDHDHGVMHNTGFVGEEPIHLDVGKLYEEPSMKIRENALLDIAKIGWKIDQAIKANYPQFADEIRKDIEAYISNAYGSDFTFAAFNLEAIWQPKRWD